MKTLANQVEEMVLEMTLKGLARIASDNLCLETWHRSYKRWIVKRPNRHPETKRCRFAFKIGKRSTSVYRNRLFWIITNRQLIPEGFHVDHRDLNRLNDAPDNLCLMSKTESHQQGNGIQEDAKFRLVSQWFQFIAEHGREPQTVAEQRFVERDF